MPQNTILVVLLLIVLVAVAFVYLRVRRRRTEADLAGPGPASPIPAVSTPPADAPAWLPAAETPAWSPPQPSPKATAEAAVPAPAALAPAPAPTPAAAPAPAPAPQVASPAPPPVSSAAPGLAWPPPASDAPPAPTERPAFGIPAGAQPTTWMPAGALERPAENGQAQPVLDQWAAQEPAQELAQWPAQEFTPEPTQGSWEVPSASPSWQAPSSPEADSWAPLAPAQPAASSPASENGSATWEAPGTEPVAEVDAALPGPASAWEQGTLEPGPVAWEPPPGPALDAAPSWLYPSPEDPAPASGPAATEETAEWASSWTPAPELQAPNGSPAAPTADGLAWQPAEETDESQPAAWEPPVEDPSAEIPAWQPPAWQPPAWQPPASQPPNPEFASEAAPVEPAANGWQEPDATLQAPLDDELEEVWDTASEGEPWTPAWVPPPATPGETQAIPISGLGEAGELAETVVLGSAPSPPTPAQGMARAELSIESGPDSGHLYRLSEGSVRMGRAPDNELILRDPATSGHHACVERRGDRYFVVDLGSTNGTLVNGNPIHESELHDGDRVTVGQNAVKFSLV